LTLKLKNTIVDIFSSTFSEREYEFIPASHKEIEEFLLNKSKLPNYDAKNTEELLYGIKHTDPNKTRAGKKRLEEIKEGDK